MTSATLDKALFLSRNLLKDRRSQGKQSENTSYFLASDLGLEKTTGSTETLRRQGSKFSAQILFGAEFKLTDRHSSEFYSLPYCQLANRRHSLNVC